MLYYYKGDLSKYDYMMIARSAVVHILSRMKYPELVDKKLSREATVKILEDNGSIVTQLNGIKNVDGVLLIETRANIDRPLLMQTSARLRCSVVVHKKKS
jgi:hypothetical protein